MGRDWYWSKPSSTSKRASDRESVPSGCISAVFHLFDFQFPLKHQTSCSCSCFKPDSFLSPDTCTTSTIKGAEAPRNSLESEEEGSFSASLTSTSTKEEEIFNIQHPIGIQIKTRSTKLGAAQNNDTFSEISVDSPGTKTPTLVARLMGLDLLPETNSPSSAPHFQSKSRLNYNHIQKPHRNSFDGDMRAGTRSLPETPRISSGRRSDVEYHHRRLSLQINKENMNASEEQLMSRLSSLKKHNKQLKLHNNNEDVENRSPAGQYYVRQIVKQVKESVSRKVGLDLTNTIRNREQSREELVTHQFKYRKISTKVADDSCPDDKHSPKLRFLESKSKDDINPDQPSKSSFSSSPANEQHKQQQRPQPHPKAASKCKKGSNIEKFGSRLMKKRQRTSDIMIRNKQEEPFVRPSCITNRVNNINPDKKCRKTPLSNHLLNNITVPATLLPVKKDNPSPSPTKVPQKQVVDAQRPQHNSQSTKLSSCSSQTYNKQEATHLHSSRDDNNNNGADRRNDAAATTTGDEAAEYEYIGRILRRSGLDIDTPLSSFTSWFSPSHPLDPSIFYYLEHFAICSTTISNINKTKFGQLRHRCNRKLLFHLVDEILIEILKPFCFNMKAWVISHMVVDGSQPLIDTLCSKIRRFPQADCRVLEDIDALIDSDLPEMKAQQKRSVTAYEEEGERIVAEIEKDILEALLHETAVELDFGVRV